LDELASVAMCAEEDWLRKALNNLVNKWQNAKEGTEDVRENVRQALVLHIECTRLETLRAAQQTLVQCDEQLIKLISDMEEFEANSKQDRVKILKGSGTALLAEEKFRRNGKKKYEVITGHIYSAGATLQALCAEASINNLEVQIDLSMLSNKCQELLKGKKVMNQNGIELMHLHTINHGTRRWSNEGEDGDENLPPVPPVNEPNPMFTRASSLPKPLSRGGGTTKTTRKSEMPTSMNNSDENRTGLHSRKSEVLTRGQGLI